MNKAYPYYKHKDINDFNELLEFNLDKKDEIAFFYKDESRNIVYKTYYDFYNDVNCLKKYIGNKYKNKHIAIVGENSYNWLTIFFAIVLSNNIAVIIDKDLSEDDMNALLKKSNTNIIFYSKGYCEFLGKQKKYAKYEIENIANYINKGKISKEIKVKLKNNKPAVMFFTSGTTGANKGVLLSQRNITYDIVAACSLFKSDGGNVFSVLPFNHSFGLVISALTPFYYGRPIFLCSSLKNVLADIKTAKPSTMFLVPIFIETFYRQIWHKARKQKKDKGLKLLIKVNKGISKLGIDVRNKLFKSIINEFGGELKYIICGGAYLDKKYIQWFRNIGIEILNGYGITECSPVVSVNRNQHYRDGSVGQLIKGCKAKIKDGEILVKGENVMLGYYKDKKSTNEVLKDGWFHTGDLGYIDEENFLFITGRKKNLIILSNGENVLPEEIEAKLCSDKAVREVVVYEQDNKIIAAIYPNDDYMGDNKYFNSLIYKYNRTVPKNHQVAMVRLRTTEFIKNNNKKILRNKVMEEYKNG
ncbi:MAG: AMP-binding protein [Bacilli bacterium]|nr:AMP-binding protein [Bacilli bacterium]